MSPTGSEQEAIGQAWAALSCDDAGGHPGPPAPVVVTGTSGPSGSRFAVGEVAVAAVAVALLAAAALSEQRGRPVPAVSLDRAHVAAAVRSERLFRLAGRPGGAGFAPLSRFWPASDGWVRTHANYPWHKQALLHALGTVDDVGAVAAAVAGLPADEVERRVYAAGGIATAVRTLAAWLDHPQGRALAGEALIGVRATGNGAPRRRPPSDLPMAGVRVLDLTRVIAGPVCTRMLAALGADVVRVDPPGRLDMPAGEVADSLLGKRSSFLDLASGVGAATGRDLVAGADVVVCGYRPGALDRFGLDEESLARSSPGIVVVYLDAWGHHGPWARRRGFDSVVQAPTGIAAGESAGGDAPGALPCQLLDHATGYLAAAAALDGLRRQGSGGSTHVRRASLARTAMWLTSLGRPTRPDSAVAGGVPDSTVAGGEPDPPPWLVDVDSARGPVTAVSPPGALGDRPLRWPVPLSGYGDDRPGWRCETPAAR